jgi:hypothetical protein
MPQSATARPWPRSAGGALWKSDPEASGTLAAKSEAIAQLARFAAARGQVVGNGGTIYGTASLVGKVSPLMVQTRNKYRNTNTGEFCSGKGRGSFVSFPVSETNPMGSPRTPSLRFRNRDFDERPRDDETRRK